MIRLDTLYGNWVQMVLVGTIKNLVICFPLHLIIGINEREYENTTSPLEITEIESLPFTVNIHSFKNPRILLF